MIHWLPASWRARIHRNFKAGWAERAKDQWVATNLANSNAMLDRKQFQNLFPDAEQRTERVMGLAKSLIAVRLTKHNEGFADAG